MLVRHHRVSANAASAMQPRAFITVKRARPSLTPTRVELQTGVRASVPHRAHLKQRLSRRRGVPAALLHSHLRHTCRERWLRQLWSSTTLTGYNELHRQRGLIGICRVPEMPATSTSSACAMSSAQQPLTDSLLSDGALLLQGHRHEFYSAAARLPTLQILRCRGNSYAFIAQR